MEDYRGKSVVITTGRISSWRSSWNSTLFAFSRRSSWKQISSSQEIFLFKLFDFLVLSKLSINKSVVNISYFFFILCDIKRDVLPKRKKETRKQHQNKFFFRLLLFFYNVVHKQQKRSYFSILTLFLCCLKLRGMSQLFRLLHRKEHRFLQGVEQIGQENLNLCRLKEKTKKNRAKCKIILSHQFCFRSMFFFSCCWWCFCCCYCRTIARGNIRRKKILRWKLFLSFHRHLPSVLSHKLFFPEKQIGGNYSPNIDRREKIIFNITLCFYGSWPW